MALHIGCILPRYHCCNVFPSLWAVLVMYIECSLKLFVLLPCPHRAGRWWSQGRLSWQRWWSSSSCILNWRRCYHCPSSLRFFVHTRILNPKKNSFLKNPQSFPKLVPSTFDAKSTSSQTRKGCKSLESSQRSTKSKKKKHLGQEDVKLWA